MKRINLLNQNNFVLSGDTEVMQYTLHKYTNQQGLDHDLIDIILVISKVVKSIGALIQTAPLGSVCGTVGDKNASGEQQQKLDVIANDSLLKELKENFLIHKYFSEENNENILLNFNGRYNFYTDPLDGSSNIDVNVGVGTIFGITDREHGDLPVGSRQLVSGYALYSSSTSFVLTWGNGTHIFTLDPEKEEFILTKENIKIPNKGKYYSINEGYSKLYSHEVNNYLNELKLKGYSLRYVGSMIADIHRTLIKGGVFLYPASKKDPEGKLRLLYEVNPIAFLVKQAGGSVLSDGRDCFEIVPESVHQRVPIVMGGKDEMSKFNY